jgi:hypothetical protein
MVVGVSLANPNRFGGRWFWWIIGSWRMVAYPPLVPVAQVGWWFGGEGGRWLVTM